MKKLLIIVPLLMMNSSLLLIIAYSQNLSKNLSIAFFSSVLTITRSHDNGGLCDEIAVSSDEGIKQFPGQCLSKCKQACKTAGAITQEDRARDIAPEWSCISITLADNKSLKTCLQYLFLYLGHTPVGELYVLDLDLLYYFELSALNYEPSLYNCASAYSSTFTKLTSNMQHDSRLNTI